MAVGCPFSSSTTDMFSVWKSETAKLGLLQLANAFSTVYSISSCRVTVRYSTLLLVSNTNYAGTLPCNQLSSVQVTRCGDALTYVPASDNHIETRSEHVQTPCPSDVIRASIQQLSTTIRFNTCVK